MPIGIYQRTEQHKKRISEGNKGHLVSEKTRRKISIALQGTIFSEERKKRIALAHIGKRHPHSEETKRKIGEANKISRKGLKLSEEHKKKLSEVKKGIRPKNNLTWIGENHPNWKGGISSQKGYHAPYIEAYRARKLKAVGNYNPIQWLSLKIKYQFMCLCCKKIEPEIKLTADHIIPLSHGGTNDISNIQPLCQSCNSIKFTKSINFIERYVIT